MEETGGKERGEKRYRLDRLEEVRLVRVAMDGLAERKWRDRI